jgi:hypothetical protein
MKPPDLFVPAFTTLSPTMLLRRPSRPAGFPFDSPRVRYFYFARNALWRVVRLFGLERGEVLMPAYHHGVEVGALLDAGARVRFYRVGARMETDLEDLERQIGPQTSAIHLTHFLGFPGPVREARAIADRHGVPLIEDCAHGLLTLDGGQPLGRTGHAAVFCLYKGLPVPNGGALVIHDPRIADPESPPPPPLGSTISALAVSMLRRRAPAPARARRRQDAAARVGDRAGADRLRAVRTRQRRPRDQPDLAAHRARPGSRPRPGAAAEQLPLPPPRARRPLAAAAARAGARGGALLLPAAGGGQP